MEEMYVGKKRNPGLVLLYGFLSLGIYNLYWYYMINHEVKSHDEDQSHSPGLATCAMFVPFFNLVSLYNTANRIKLMQKADGSTDLISPGAALLWAIFFGIGYPIYVQSAMNNHWHEHAIDCCKENNLPEKALPAGSADDSDDSLDVQTEKSNEEEN